MSHSHGGRDLSEAGTSQVASWGQKVQRDEQVQRLWAGGAGRAWGGHPGWGSWAILALLLPCPLRPHAHILPPRQSRVNHHLPQERPRTQAGDSDPRSSEIQLWFGPAFRQCSAPARGVCLWSHSATGYRLQMAGFCLQPGHGEAAGEGRPPEVVRAHLAGRTLRPARMLWGGVGGAWIPEAAQGDGGRSGSCSTEHENEQ